MQPTVEETFHPTIDLLLQFSTASHPRIGARNPQERVSPKGVYCPLTTTKFLQPFQSTSSLSPQPAQPKEWDPLLCHAVPQAIPLPSKGSNTIWIGNISVGDSKNLVVTRILTTKTTLFLTWKFIIHKSHSQA
jgi:hypothetical protein